MGIFLLSVLAIFATSSVFGDECLRATRRKVMCTAQCVPSAGCADTGRRKKKCVCDGDCGYSCVKEDLKCEQLSIRNGRMISNGRDFNATAQFECNAGYTMFGSSHRQCRGSGRWDGKRTKCRKACPEPGINEFSRRDERKHPVGFKVATTLTYYCVPGYRSATPLLLQCLPSGKWSSLPPVCKPQSCGRLQLPTNTMVHSPRNWQNNPKDNYGSRVRFRCAPGYRSINGIGMMICLGSWRTIRKISCYRRSCTDPGTPSNGRKNGLLYMFESRVTYTCDPCHRLDGPSYRICQANGRWTDSTPRCILTQCMDPGKIANGRTLISTKPMYCNTVIRFQCFIGYRLRGASKTTCMKNSNWSNSNPTCELINCGDPGRPVHGRTHAPNGHTYSRDVTFSCDDGYVLRGNTLATCQEDGKWSKAPPTCLAKCSDPSLTTNAHIYGREFFHGKTVSFKCSRKYTLEPYQSTKLKCENGKWSGKIPQCKAPCRSLPRRIQNGGYSRRYFTIHGSTASFYCNRGYRMRGQQTTTCQDGSWSNLAPRCLAICGRIGRLDNGQVKGSGNLEGNTLRFTCDQDYVMEGEKEVTCRSDRAWSASKPVCKAPCQKKNNPLNGWITKNGFKHNEEVSFQCQQDYVMEGRVTLRCDEGSWSAEAPRCLAHCSRFQPFSNGYIVSNGYRHGEQITFGCHNQSFVIDGHATLHCSDGNWDNDRPVCAGPCEQLQPPKDGQIVQNGYKHNEKIVFKCNKGYNLHGPSTRICRLGAWSEDHEQTTCKVANCGDPGDPQNGQTISLEGFTYGHSVSFVCDRDYFLQGKKWATCQEDGNWSNRLPICTAPCKQLQLPRNGRIVQNGYKHNEKIVFECNKGYNIHGPSTRICRLGVWSEDHERTTCEVANCQHPGHPQNGQTISFEGFTYGHSVSFVCDHGYFLQGKNRATCQEDENWSNHLPKCIKSRCEQLQPPKDGQIVQNGYKHNEKIAFKCNKGYNLHGPSTRICRLGVWSDDHEQTTCKVANCQHPGHPQNGQTIGLGRGFTYGRNVSFVCHHGYFLQGKDRATCQEDENWSNNLPKCIKFVGTCEDPSRSTNAGVSGNDFSDGQRVTFSCSDEKQVLEPGESRTLICSSGTWNNTIPSCKAPCAPPQKSIENGRKASKGKKHGTSIKYDCNDGYKLDKNTTITCDNGTWVGTLPKCIAVIRCDEPDIPENGYIGTIYGYTPGKYVTFRCNSGYKFKHRKSYWSKCQMDGTWSKLPKCLNL